jgi:hypothetical protein
MEFSGNSCGLLWHVYLSMFKLFSLIIFVDGAGNGVSTYSFGLLRPSVLKSSPLIKMM